MAARKRHRQENLRFLVYTSFTYETTVTTECPEEVEFDLARGSWCFGSCRLDIGNYMLFLSPRKGVPIGVFDITVPSHITALRAAEKKIAAQDLPRPLVPV